MTMVTAMGDEQDGLSGFVLPLILRRKLENDRKASDEGKDESKDTADEKNDTSGDMVQQQQGAGAVPNATANVVFTSEELEERIWHVSAAMADIQKQLYRGEESYHEETNGHGNLYRGWDAFIDKDVGTIGIGASAPPSFGGGAGSRRMPADHRWFSGSCQSIGRTTRPAPLLTVNLSAGPTENATSVRSETITPVPAPSSVGDSQERTEKHDESLQTSGGKQESEHVEESEMQSLPKVEFSVPQMATYTAENSQLSENEAAMQVSELANVEQRGVEESGAEEQQKIEHGHFAEPTPSKEGQKVDTGRRTTRKRKTSES